MKVITETETIDLGVTETSPTISISDFSRRVTDDFGVTTVVKRGFARRLSLRFAVPFDEADALQRRLADLRATAAQWVADDRFEWLKPVGFYKEFAIDLAIPPVSYCTLTVDGLAETEAGADTGNDPAPDGQDSTLRLLQPVEISSAMLTSSTLPENDYPAWSAGSSYAAGARVIKTAAHRIYESLSAGNIGHDPASSAGYWTDIGPTNRWAMFDQAIGTASQGAGGFAVTLSVTGANAVALLDVVGAQVRVQAGGYDRTVAVGPGAIVFADMPDTTGAVTVTITGTGAVSVGTLLVGQLVTLGITEASPNVGIDDFSKKGTDEFGEVTVVPRSWRKRMSAKALIRTDAIDDVANRIAGVRALPSLWIGDDGLDNLIIYGFFKDFSIEVGASVSKLSLSVEGLSEAMPIVPGLAAPVLVSVYRNAASRPAKPPFGAGEVPAGWSAPPEDMPPGQYRWITQAEFLGGQQQTPWSDVVQVGGASWADIIDDDPARPKPEDGATVGATPEEREQIDQIALIDGYVAAMQPRLTAAEDAIEDLQASVVPPDIDELRDRILAAEGEIDTVETTLGTQDARISTAQTTANTAVGDLAEVSTRLTTAESSISSTLTVIQTLEDTIAQANLELIAQDARITQNALAISTVEGQQASFELDLDTLGASVNSLAIATSTLDGNVATLTTELRASAKTRGGNLLTNTDFANDLSGWSHGGSMLADQYTRDYPGSDWHPSGEHALTMYHGVKTADGSKYSDANSDRFSVEANKTYECSVYVAAHRCLVIAYIGWLNSSGSVIYYQPGPLLTALGGGKDLTNYSRYWFKDTAPAGAVAAFVILRKFINTVVGEDSYAWWCRPQVAEISANDQSPQAYKPGNAGASIRFQAAALATLTMQLAQVDLSAQTAGVNAGLALQAITQVENDVTLLYGRAALTVGLGGIISGVEINGTPVGSTIDFSATATRFRDPSGAGPRTEYEAGIWRIFAGSTMLIWGSPFGTSGQFVRWFGPALSSISQCSEGNAIEYLKTNGDAYFGGALSAGTLRNSVTSTSPSATASVLMENIGSNGHARSLVLSYSWSLSRTVSGTPPTPVNPTATINLYRGTDAGGVLIATLNVGPGDYQTEPAGGGQTQIDSSMSGSLTVNDTSGGVSVSYYAVISARNVVAGGVPVQRITIVSTED